MRNLLCVCLLLCLRPVLAATLYVDGVNGNDGNTGLLSTAAYKTLQKAADGVNPGDTVLVMNGSYTNSWTGVPVVSITRSGTAASWITFKAYPGHKPLLTFTDAWQGFLIRANYIIVDGFEVKGGAAGITLAYAQSQANNGNDPTTSGNGIAFGTTDGASPVQHHVIIRNNTVHHCPGGGIGTGYADYMTIDNNVVYDNSWWSPYGGSGISTWEDQDSDGNTGYKIYITRNICYGNEEYIPVLGSGGQITDGNGIIVDRTNDKSFGGRTLVANNIVYSNGGSGIHAFLSSHVDIVNNTAYMNNHSPSPLTNGGQIFSNTGNDIYIYNNILYAPTNRVVNSNWNNATVVTDYNIDFGGTSIANKGPHDIVGDPLFVNAAAGDFHLSAGSPAIGKGTSTKAPATDITGAARVAAHIDCGAYLFGSPATPPAITTQPANKSATAGQTVTFTVAASGTAPLTYQWQKNGVNIPGATAASYTTPATATSDSGSTYRCVVTNSAGSATSNSAALTVAAAPNRPPVIASASATPTTAQTGQSIAFAAAASDPDGDALTYAWTFGDGASGSGASAAHVYASAGIYAVVVSVSDNHNPAVTATVTVTVTAVTPPPVAIAVNSGGAATGAFVKDSDFSGGRTYTTSHHITLGSVVNPAPAAVYQSERYGNFNYAFLNLTDGVSYTVRLHFAEIWWSAAGKRIFNVAINGAPVMSNFDIFAAAGGNYIALVREFSATPVNGAITIAFTTLKDNAKSSGIELISAAPGTRATVAVIGQPDSAPSDGAGEITSINLGTVKAGQRFKLQLEAPEDNPKPKLRWSVMTRKTLPPGVTAAGGYISGHARKPGVYTFDLQIQSAGAAKSRPTIARNSYTLTVTQ